MKSDAFEDITEYSITMNSKNVAENSECSPVKIACQKANFKFTRAPLKLLNNQNTNAAPIERTRITDLNYDCLEYMMRAFNLEHLMSVGSTCVRLNDAVCRIFTLMFRKHEVCIDCNQFPRFIVRSQSIQPNQRHSVGNNIESFLTVFGTVIKKIIVSNMSPLMKYEDLQRTENDKKIERLLIRYCKEYLTEIRFQNCGERTMFTAQPFNKITKVLFEKCVLGEKMSNFSYLFPGMRMLEMNDCNVTRVRNSIEKEFPHLESLNLTVPHDLNFLAGSAFSVENIMAAIDHNPNLKSLSLYYWNETAYDAKLLKYASVMLKELKTVQLWHTMYTDLCSHGNIDFKSIRKLILTNFYHVPGRLLRNLDMFTCDNLQTFCMNGEFDTECTTFISRHKTIKKVMILPTGKHDWYPSNEDIRRIASVLPYLQKINVDGSRMTANGLFEIISQCSTLIEVKVRRFKFTVAIRKLLQWKCSNIGWKIIYSIDNAETKMSIKKQDY